MSVHYSSKVWKLETDSIAEKLILLKLADNANDQGACWPSVECMASECQMDVRTAQRGVRALEQKNWLVITPRSGHSSIYKLTLPEITPGTTTPRQVATPAGCHPPPAYDHPSPGTVSPPPPAQRHPEPSVEPSTDPSKIRQGEKPSIKGSTVIPDTLKASEPFRLIWVKWLEHLKQKRKPATLHAQDLQLRECAIWGVDRSIRAIEYSIKGGFQGLYESRNNISKPAESNSIQEPPKQIRMI